MERDECIDHLKKAYKSGKLSLYLGAGISVASGLPTWEKLVSAMYFSAIQDEGGESRLRPFPNYLFAIAEWHLSRRQEPLDITARKIKGYYNNEQEFLQHLRKILYAKYVQPWSDQINMPYYQQLEEQNKTLSAVAQLCRSTEPGNTGIETIITYNYDNLLEITLSNFSDKFIPIWNSKEKPLPEHVPVYHVHGYVPVEGQGSSPGEIIFSEEQYHKAAQDDYYWGNLVQLKTLGSSTGLMVGLSLTDRNIRRLMDAVQQSPILTNNFIIIRKPHWPRPEPYELERIHQKALDYLQEFEGAGVKSAGGRYDQIEQIIQGVEERDFQEQAAVFRAIGIHPIWYDEHDEVEQIISKIKEI